MNRLTQVTDAIGGVTKYEYDAEGNLMAATDADLNRTTFEYDTLNRLVKQTDPQGLPETFQYDTGGNLIETIDRKVQMLKFEYDKVNQLTKKTLPGNLVMTYQYDPSGNLTGVVDSDSALNFVYDLSNRLESAVFNFPLSPEPYTLNYTYDKNGNRLTMADGLTGPTTYVYDVLNRLTSIQSPTNQLVKFDYDELGRRKTVTWPNGVVSNYAYDAASQLAGLAHKLGTNTISSFGYSYDKVGNRTAVSVQRSGVSVQPNLAYSYDPLYHLTQATRPLAAQPNETFNYDAVGNRLRRDGQAVDAQFDRGNRLIADADFNYS